MDSVVLVAVLPAKVAAFTVSASDGFGGSLIWCPPSHCCLAPSRARPHDPPDVLAHVTDISTDSTASSQGGEPLKGAIAA